MTYKITVDFFSDFAVEKFNFLKRNFIGYIISSMLAGIYMNNTYIFYRIYNRSPQ